MESLVLKLVLTPALIGLASLAGRRWGPAVSGWLVGLPFTSGPVAFFLVLGRGTTFAAAASLGTLAGSLSDIAFCLAYAWLALRWSWPGTVLAGCLAFLAATAALRFVVLPAAPLYLIVVAALLGALRLMPAVAKRASSVAVSPPRWDLPARMVVATVFLILLTGASAALGPHLTGLLSPFPLYAVILAGFAHHRQGPAAAAGVLRGLLLGLFAFASFFLVLATLLVPVGAAAAFAVAIAVALALQGGSLWVLRRAPAR
jgi:hypothetical protein